MSHDFRRFNAHYCFSPIWLGCFWESFFHFLRKFFGEIIKSLGRYFHIAQFFKLCCFLFIADNALLNQKLKFIRFIAFHAYSPRLKNKILTYYLNCLAFIQAAAASLPTPAGCIGRDTATPTPPRTIPSKTTFSGCL